MSIEHTSPRCGATCAGLTLAAAGRAADDGIGRRTFLVQAGLLAAAAALAACGAGGDSTAPSIPSGTTIKVTDYSSLSAIGGVALVTVSNARLAIVRSGASNFVALSRVCP